MGHKEKQPKVVGWMSVSTSTMPRSDTIVLSAWQKGPVCVVSSLVFDGLIWRVSATDVVFMVGFEELCHG